MSLTNRNVIFMAMVMFCIILMTVLTGIIISEEDDQLPDDDFLEAGNFAAAWFRIPVHQLSFILMLGMSIFALFVVYLGGRSNHKRFYDRTIDSVKLLPVVFLKTALNRAVFIFLFLGSHADHAKHKLTHIILFPTLIPILRRY
jgi:hypothetical protein